MEEGVCTVADSFVTIYASWTKYTDRRLCRLHYTALYAGCMCTQNDIVRHFGIVINKESVLHIACRMVFRKVHGREYMPVVFDFRSVCDVETHSGKNIDDFVLHDCERMACTKFHRISRTGQIQSVATVVLVFKLLFQRIDFILRFRFQFIQPHADFLFLLSRYVAKICH